MTGYFSSVAVQELRFFLAALLGSIGAAGMEPAAGGRIYRTGNLTLQHIFILFPQTGVRLGDSLQQELCIGVPGVLINVFCTAYLTDLAQEHDTHTVGKVTDNA